MPGKSSSTLRYVGNVATTLADGQPIEPGQYVELSQDQINDEYNADLIQREQLIEVEEGLAKEALREQRKEEREAEKVQEQIVEVTQEGGKP